MKRSLDLLPLALGALVLGHLFLYAISGTR